MAAVPETGRERQLSIALIRADGLRRLDSFPESARRDGLYVFESHPIQSTVRVLFQLDAAAAANEFAECIS